jgi:hypothetical protein
MEIIRQNEIFRQKFNYYRITLTKNYCSLSKKPEVRDDPFLFGHHSNGPLYSYDNHHYLHLQKQQKVKKRFFYTDKDGGEYVHVEYAFKGDEKHEYNRHFETTKERHVKKYYPNPFAHVEALTYERTISVSGDKVYVRYYQHMKERGINSIYFTKRTVLKNYTFNLKTGDITVTSSNYHGKVKTKTYRKNTFSFIETHVNSGSFFRSESLMSNKSRVFNEFNNAFNDKEFVLVLLKTIGQNDSDIFNKTITRLPSGDIINNTEDDGRVRINRQVLLYKFVSFFIEKKKIKAPDDFFNLIINHYPTEKYLKKNKRKLVQAILDSYGIKSKLTIKMFHEHPTINLSEFSLFCSFFGDEYTKFIGNINELGIESFKKNSVHAGNGIKYRKPNHIYVLKNTEKENLIKIVNSIPEGKSLSSLFLDHFDMISKIRAFDPTIQMNAINYDDFNLEHSDLAKIITLINKGWTTEYVYDNRMVRKVEEEIISTHGNKTRTFIPVILKRSEEYAEEGSFMHHCVASYINRDKSMIISVRTDKGSERVTCEFDKKTGENIQCRYFTNATPPEYFDEALKILKQRVKRFSTQRLLIHIETKKVRAKVNGIEVPLIPEPDLFPVGVQPAHQARMIQEML